MWIYLCSALVAAPPLVALTVKRLSPYLWADIFYIVDLVRILLKFAWRRRRSDFFALDRFLEQTVTRPDKPFVVFENDVYTFASTDRTSNRVANALLAHPGYTAGDAVALFMPNEPAFIFTWLALAKLGSPVALLNYNIRTKSLLHCFNCSKARVLIAAAGKLEATSVWSCTFPLAFKGLRGQQGLLPADLYCTFTTQVLIFTWLTCNIIT